jgi:hypothetical protein
VDKRSLFERAVALDSFNVDALFSSAQLSMTLGDSETAKMRSRQCLRAAPPSPSYSACALFLAFVNAPRDQASMAMLDTSSRWAQAQLMFAFIDSPDSNETGILVARRLFKNALEHSDVAPVSISPTLFNPGAMLAQALAVRGHLREAWKLTSERDNRSSDGLAGQIAALDGVPSDSLIALLRRNLAVFDNREVTAMWWLMAGADTVALRRTISLADSLRRSPTISSDLRYNLARYERAARAHLTLARGDTDSVMAELLAIANPSRPDSALPMFAALYLRYSDARLLAAKGRLEEAARWLAPTPMAYFDLAPFGVLWRLERARVAERMGNRPQAIEDYWYVVHMWQHADSVLQPYMTEARAGMRRLRSDR